MADDLTEPGEPGDKVMNVAELERLYLALS